MVDEAGAAGEVKEKRSLYVPFEGSRSRIFDPLSSSCSPAFPVIPSPSIPFLQASTTLASIRLATGPFMYFDNVLPRRS